MGIQESGNSGGGRREWKQARRRRLNRQHGLARSSHDGGLSGRAVSPTSSLYETDADKANYLGLQNASQASSDMRNRSAAASEGGRLRKRGKVDHGKRTLVFTLGGLGVAAAVGVPLGIFLANRPQSGNEPSSTDLQKIKGDQLRQRAQEAPSLVSKEAIRDPVLYEIFAGSSMPYMPFAFNRALHTETELQTADPYPINGTQYEYSFPVAVQSKTWVNTADGTLVDAVHKNDKFDQTAANALRSKFGAFMTLSISADGSSTQDNDTYLTNALNDPQTYIQKNIVEYAQGEGHKYRGIIVDYENLSGTSRDNFTEYVRQLTQAASAAKPPLPVLVTLNHNHGTFRWNFQDLTALNKIPNLRFILMAVDKDTETTGDPPGPNITFPWMRLLFDEIENQMGTDALRKLIVEVPTYSKDWEYINGQPMIDMQQGIGNDNVSMRQALQIRSSAQRFDESVDPLNPYFSYTDPRTLHKHTIYYVTMTSLFGAPADGRSVTPYMEGILPKAQKDLQRRLGDAKYRMPTSIWALGYQDERYLRALYNMGK